MSARALPGLAGLLLAGSVGCSVLAGLSGDRHLADGTGGSTVSSTGTGGATCMPAAVPAPPAVKGKGGSVDFTAALRSIDLGETMASMPKVGLDLDGVCTCPGPPSCAELSWAEGSHCDAADGRDNATGQAFSLINTQLQMPIINSALFSQQADSGAWSILLRVRDYDGGDDDDQVEVDVYPTTGLGTKPTWDGTDTWPVTDSALVDKTSLDQPVYKDPGAYVSGGVLVAKIPALPLLFVGPGVHLQLDLGEATLSATLVPADGGGFRLTGGTLAATWKLSSVFADLAGLRVNGNSSLCVGSGYYAIIKQQLCNATDLASSGGSTAPCDALSFGMSFEAWPAVLGAATAVAPLTNGCPMTTDPTNDACGM